MNDCLEHPETLLTGPNPLFGVLRPFVTLGEVPALLNYNPLSTLDLKTIPLQKRESLLPFAEQLFIPSGPNLEVFMGVQELLRRSLSLMNPLQRAARLHANRIGAARSTLQLRQLICLDGAGMLVSGITGRGKTRLIKRCLQVLVKHLVLDHPASEEYGWYGMRQVAYLYVDFPSNGTRGALLHRILEELDSVAGTNYSGEHKRTVNIDILMVAVCKALINHRVALLVVDEKQSMTFNDSQWALQFVLFYLSLMNLGVSVALCGNPLAFDHMMNLSQVMRRFSIAGVHELTPGQQTDPWWTKEFVPRVDEFMLVDGFAVDLAWRSEVETNFSAGIPGFLLPLRCEVMRSAIRRGGSPCLISEDDYDEALNSPRLKKIASISQAIQGIPNSDHYFDLPSTECLRNPSLRAKHDVAQLDAASGSAVLELLRKLQQRVSAELTRTRNKLKEIQGLSKEDAEALGLTLHHVNELQDSIAKIEQHKKDLAQRGRNAKAAT
ncbi:ATP-binding protein [Piscinibacter sp. HJYY11]|uniref:ATP-binding protein n=1 Tax=Piscinibacter sp. HJYY11 TaxID=2801333 RepID=UPI00191FE93C|nr:ATP-binding protein [Piscinibacter sp. HJYY11]MBL0729572.1 ATP-binding protein [Piscinibacter sp. HJYY11]